MSLFEITNDIGGAIQLALAPVFLLTGIAGMLNVMSGRLSRIIDRGRSLKENKDVIATYEQTKLHSELNMLERRRLSFLSVDVQTLQSHPIMGTPLLVPLPRKTICNGGEVTG